MGSYTKCSRLNRYLRPNFFLSAENAKSYAAQHKLH